MILAQIFIYTFIGNEDKYPTEKNFQKDIDKTISMEYNVNISCIQLNLIQFKKENII